MGGDGGEIAAACLEEGLEVGDGAFELVALGYRDQCGKRNAQTPGNVEGRERRVEVKLEEGVEVDIGLNG